MSYKREFEACWCGDCREEIIIEEPIVDPKTGVATIDFGDGMLMRSERLSPTEVLVWTEVGGEVIGAELVVDHAP